SLEKGWVGLGHPCQELPTGSHRYCCGPAALARGALPPGAAGLCGDPEGTRRCSARGSLWGVGAGEPLASPPPTPGRETLKRRLRMARERRGARGSPLAPRQRR
ncbi:hypothetical protein H1C71_006499, partial [Ictidomys tridecemlineatus]